MWNYGMAFLLIGLGGSTLCSAQPEPTPGGFYGLRPDAYGVAKGTGSLNRPAGQTGDSVDVRVRRDHPPAQPSALSSDCKNTLPISDSTYWVSRIAALPHRDVLLLFPYLLQRAPTVAFHVPMMPPTLAGQPHHLSSAFGWRHHPLLGGVRWHGGIDIAGPPQPVKATAFGTVVAVRYEAGYGLYIRLDHGNSYETLYGHLSGVRVREGQRVQPGQVMAISGRSGRVTGYHLHYEVRKGGQAIDPVGYMTAVIRFIEQYRSAATIRTAGRIASD